MVRYTIDEIPTDIKYEVIEKWTDVLEEGVWHSEIWRRCALCSYVGMCPSCPLPMNDWCRDTGPDSRISIRSHMKRHHSYSMNTTDEIIRQEWLTSVKRFIEWLIKHTEIEDTTKIWNYFNKELDKNANN